MNTTNGTSSRLARSRAPRSLRLPFAAVLCAAALAAPLAAQTAAALTVANETPGGFNCDVYRWIDSTGVQRSAALVRNNAADPANSHGGYLRQYRFTPAGTAPERVVTGTGANGWAGWGYVVNHYGDLQFGGDGSNPTVSGVGWGDKYKFVTTSAPLTPQSTWDYSQANTVPYTHMWINNPDAEMGAVQTQTWLQHNTGGSWFTDNWGHTSANRVVGDGSSFGSWMMPANWQWPYQLNQYELMDDTSSTTSKRCAWGLMYGAVGRTSYSGYGYENTYSGHPYQSYSVAMVVGRHSTADVATQVTRTERVLAATITANTGALVTTGPGGAGRTDSVAYAKAGYNATYGAYEFTAASGAFSTTLATTGAVTNPTFIIRGMGGVPAQISLDGTPLVADEGYFASYDSASQTLWLTVATDWNGSHTLASGTGVPPAVTVTVAPTTATLGRGMTTTFTAPVTYAANTTVTWSVVEAGGGSVSTSGAYTAPSTLGTYHVRATSVADPAVSAQAAITVANLAPTYTYIYQSGRQGGWSNAGWGSIVNFAAGTLGHSGTAAAEVTIPTNWAGLALGDISNWQTETYHYLSDVDTIEFDIYPHSDSVGFEDLVFMLDDNVDGTEAEAPAIVDLIPGWASMTTAQRYDHWHHVVVDLASLHAEFDRFLTVVFFKMAASGNPHFRLADIRLGSVPDVTAPVVTLGTPTVADDQLILPFTTDEAATYRIEYGYGNYSQTITGPADGWATSHNPVLTGLTRGATVQYRIVATDRSGNAGFATGSAVITDPPASTEPTVTITVDPANTHTISPWIYGMNFYQDSAASIRNLTINRLGGNRWTAYNWENNASNSGSDWGPYSNDSHLGGGDTPAEAVRGVIATDRTRGNASIFTVQMQGYVAADKNGLLTLNFPTHLAQRFKQVVFKKPITTAGAFTTTPSTTDASVYMDEFVWAMNQKIPGLYTDPINPTFILLDNEPELWPATHAEIQQSPISVADYLAKTVALTKAIKDVAPSVKTFGPVHYGYNGIVNWQNTTSYTFTSDYWFTDKYLADMRAASEADGRRLLDVYNFHWYSEARASGTRVINLVGPNLTEAQIQAIVQSPRSLWDPTYTEDSWVAQHLGGPVRILARLKEKIATRYPGTGLAITEWANGGGNHIAGALAVADNLGIFGQQGLFMASMWPDGDASNHTLDLAGFKMYRDFDGALASFGDICLPTVSSNTALVSAYVSRDSAQPGRHVIVAINRSAASQAVNFTGLDLAGTARLYRMTGTSLDPVLVGNPTIDLATWIVALPAYSITTIEITAAAQANYAAWRAANFTGADLTNDAISAPLADPDAAGINNFARYAFAHPARGPVANPVSLGTATVGTDTFITLTFPRRTVATDLNYVVESSADLITWSTVPDRTYGPGSDPITAEDVVPLASETRRFLRLRVTIP